MHADPPAMELFFSAPPGLEPFLAAEATRLGFASVEAQPGGVRAVGGWPEVWRANLWLRGAGRVLARVAEFRAPHLAVLDKRARRVPWADLLRPDVPLRVEASCRKSRIYHAGAAATRIEQAIKDAIGAPLSKEDGLRVLVRIEEDLCTISLDTSGEPLHRRGAKQFVGKAPLRETLASLCLDACDYRPGEALVDPMCGSGTFVLEAAERTAGLAPGRARSFAFESLARFDRAGWSAMREAKGPEVDLTEARPHARQTLHRGADAEAPGGACQQEPCPPVRFVGSDRDQGAIAGARSNAARAGISDRVAFRQCAVSDARPPDAGPPGLVIVNPPYGGRIGNKKLLYALYGRFGEVMRERFTGWRVGLITSEPGLARATGLPFGPPGPAIPHGGLSVRLHQCGPLK